jgi:MFS family permease
MWSFTNNHAVVRETELLCIQTRANTKSAIRIVFRAFQGIGASGCYALAVVMSFELVPKREWPTYMALSTLALVLSMGLGPVLGGAITIKGD